MFVSPVRVLRGFFSALLAVAPGAERAKGKTIGKPWHSKWSGGASFPAASGGGLCREPWRNSQLRLTNKFFSFEPQEKGKKTTDWSGCFYSCEIACKLQCSKGKGFIYSSILNAFFCFLSSVIDSYEFPLFFLQSKQALTLLKRLPEIDPDM